MSDGAKLKFYRWFTWTLGHRFLALFDIFPFPQEYRLRRKMYREGRAK